MKSGIYHLFTSHEQHLYLTDTQDCFGIFSFCSNSFCLNPWATAALHKQTCFYFNLIGIQRIMQMFVRMMTTLAEVRFSFCFSVGIKKTCNHLYSLLLEQCDLLLLLWSNLVRVSYSQRSLMPAATPWEWSKTTQRPCCYPPLLTAIYYALRTVCGIASKYWSYTALHLFLSQFCLTVDPTQPLFHSSFEIRWSPTFDKKQELLQSQDTSRKHD